MSVLLVVDDVPEVAWCFGSILGRLFEQTHTATSYAEAVTLAPRAVPPITHLVCDYNLDGGQVGTELIARLRAAHPSIRVAVLVSGADVGHLASSPGVDKFFAKPVVPTEVIAYLCATGV